VFGDRVFTEVIEMKLVARLSPNLILLLSLSEDKDLAYA
jgi:hypothetical protein